MEFVELLFSGVGEWLAGQTQRFLRKLGPKEYRGNHSLKRNLPFFSLGVLLFHFLAYTMAMTSDKFILGEAGRGLCVTTLEG